MIDSTTRFNFCPWPKSWRRWLAFAALAVVPLTALGSISTEIAWYASADPNVTGYNIYYGTNSHVYTETLAVGNVTNAVIGDLQPGTTYFFSVKSHNAAGTEGGFSTETLFAGCTATPLSGPLRIKTFPGELNGDQLVFSLAPGSPAGARINPTNGVVTWLPGYADANSTQVFNVSITDVSNPTASTLGTIVVTVSDYLKLGLASVPVQSGATDAMPLSVLASDGITNLTINLVWPGNALLNPQLTFAAPVAGGTVENQGTNLCISLWTANGDVLQGTNAFAQLNFQAAAGQTSAFLSLPVTSVSANKADGTTFSNLQAQDGEVVVIGTNPLLRSHASPDLGRTLSIYANPGNRYQIQYCTDLGGATGWQPLQTIQATNVLQTVSLDSANPVVFYRLMQN